MGLRRKFYLLGIIVLSIMSFTGCVPQEVKLDSPLQIGEANGYSMSKSQKEIYDDVRRKAMHISDEAAENYLKSLFDSRTKKYGDSVTFDYSGERILRYFAASMKNALPANAEKLLLITKFDWCHEPQVYVDDSVPNGNLMMHVSIIKDCGENQQYPRVTYYWSNLCDAVINILPVHDGRATNLSLNEFTTRGQATLTSSNNYNKLIVPRNTCNREQFMSLINSIPNSMPKPESVVEQDYDSYVAQIVQEVEGKLKNRYSVRKGDPLKTEKTYNVSFEVAVGRLQRALNNYKYEKEHSTFTFEDDVDIRGKLQKRIVTVSLFPETKNRVAVDINMTYNLIVDSMSPNVYGDKEARDSFESTINYLNSLLRES